MTRRASTATIASGHVDMDCLKRCLAERDDITLAYLFGSQAEKRGDRLSDVDLAVLLSSSPTKHERLRRYSELLTRLGECVDSEIDLVFLNQAPPLLAYEVLRHGRLLYSRNSQAQSGFVVRARRAYFDFKPRLEQHSQATMKRIKEVGLGRGERSDSGALEAARRLHPSAEAAE